MKKHIFVEVSSGVVQNIAQAPFDDTHVEVIDWDNLMDDPKSEWPKLTKQAQDFIQENYPEDYLKLIPIK